MGLTALEAQAAGDVVRNLLAMTARPIGFGARRVGDSPLIFELSHLPLPDFFTFTRGGTLPYFRIADDAGGERWVECTDADQPRISSPDGKLSRRGLLIEPTRDNKAKRSRSIGNDPPWDLVNAPTVDANVRDAPDGAETADDVEDNSGANERVEQNSMGLALTPHVASIFARRISGATAGKIIFFDGTVQHTINLGTSGLWERTINGPWTVSGADTAEITLVPAQDPADVGKYSFWLAQVEEGEHPTSPVPAGAAAVTRQGDDAIGDASMFGGRITEARGRLRTVFTPQFASGEEDSRNYVASFSTNDGVYFQNSFLRIVLGGTLHDSILTSHARGDAFSIDWIWGNGETSVDVRRNGVLEGRLSTPNVVSAVANLYLGGRPDGIVQASGVFSSLVIG